VFLLGAELTRWLVLTDPRLGRATDVPPDEQEPVGPVNGVS